MTIEVHTTRSGMLLSVTYNDADGTLTVTFNNGGTYAYLEVPKEVFSDLIAAESAGKFFLANVKNKYECEKV